MFIETVWGSTWQLLGSDRYDATVGSGPVGIAYSEWALCNPAAWAYHKPMIEESNGTAAFITTPRGANHAKTMYERAKGNDNWYAELSSIEDTGALTPEQLAESLAEYQDLYGIDLGLAMFQQEYYCSFSGAMIGAYWGAEMFKADNEHRTDTPIEIDPNYPVHTAWDLGKAVNNPIWCFQVIGGKPKIVDFYRPTSDDLEDWCKWLDVRGYNGTDYVPHDVAHFNWGAKRTRFDMLRDMKRKPFKVDMVSVADGLNAGRETIKLATFHGGDDERAERVLLGMSGLKNYRREWDDELKTFRENPVKDWAEHIGSSFRYLGLAWREAIKAYEPPQKPKEQEYQADKHGRIVATVNVDEAIKAMIARKQKARNGE